MASPERPQSPSSIAPNQGKKSGFPLPPPLPPIPFTHKTNIRSDDSQIHDKTNASNTKKNVSQKEQTKPSQEKSCFEGQPAQKFTLSKQKAVTANALGKPTLSSAKQSTPLSRSYSCDCSKMPKKDPFLPCVEIKVKSFSIISMHKSLITIRNV